MSLKYIFILFFLMFLFDSCVSVEKYNQQITKKHSPRKLRKDTDFAYKKLQALHPDLYWYISKNTLDKKFENLKDKLQKPLTSREYYVQLAPVIAAIKQGHTSIYPPKKKKTKTDKKAKLKNESLFKPLRFKRVNNKLFITKNFGKDSTLFVGSELLKVGNEKVENLLKSFEKLTTSDGYNKTFIPKFTSRYFGSFYTKTHPKKDSISLILKNRDSIYHYYLYTQHKKENNSLKKGKDSLKQKLSSSQRKLLKLNEKKRRKRDFIYGYDKYTKENARNFKFIAPDSLHLISYIKIRGFHNGNYKKFYAESFAKIDSAKSKTLIIDLRDNLGGRLSEIDELYSYLTDKEYVFIKEAKMVKAKNFTYPFLHSKSWLTKSLSIVLYPILKITQAFKVKKINGKPNFTFKTFKLRKPKSNPYQGKIFVLINGTSFSASSILANHLKATQRATFIGEETGGAYNGTVAGMFATIELPNSKVKMRVGLMTLKTPYLKEPDGYGVKPDIKIETTRLDMDEQLEWVINDVLKSIVISTISKPSSK